MACICTDGVSPASLADNADVTTPVLPRARRTVSFQRAPARYTPHGGNEAADRRYGHSHDGGRARARIAERHALDYAHLVGGAQRCAIERLGAALERIVAATARNPAKKKARENGLEMVEARRLELLTLTLPA